MSDQTGISADVVQAAAAGDRAAIRRILTVIQPLVTRYCRARLPGSPDADDAAQEAMIAVLRGLGSYRPQGGRPFLAWVYAITAHKVADVHRAQARRPVDLVSTVPGGIAQVPGPEDLALAGEEATELQRMLGALPQRQREVLTLRVMWQLSAQETADVIDGATAGSVRVAQHRALTWLRKHLAGE